MSKITFIQGIGIASALLFTGYLGYNYWFYNKDYREWESKNCRLTDTSTKEQKSSKELNIAQRSVVKGISDRINSNLIFAPNFTESLCKKNYLNDKFGLGDKRKIKKAIVEFLI
jgi:hypothetical protein